MYLTGFADEAAQDLATQIEITKELGWKNIESRNIGGKNIHDLSEEDFDKVYDALGEADVKVNCFGSAIANWAKDVRDDFDITIAEIERAIPRMQRLGTKLIRIMSYKRNEGDDQYEAERFRRLNEIIKRFNDAGLTPVHENCMNYGGMSWQHTIKMLENVPAMKLVHDTGNPVFNKDMSKPEPRPYQDAFEFYQNTKEHIAYVHIKDAIIDENDECVYKFPGEGDGYVIETLKDLKANGYDGGISIEPHLAAIFHDPGAVNTAADKSAELYLEYGERLKKIMADLDWSWD